MDKKINKKRGFLKTKDNTELFFEFFRSSKSHETIVLINGIFQCAFHWYPIINHLLNKFNVIIYDLRGQGKTKINNNEISMEKHISDLYELVSYFKLTKVYIAGMSFGAYVAIKFSKNYINYVKKIFLLGIGMGYRTNMLLKAWIKMLNILDKTTFLELVIPLIFSNNFLKKHKSKISQIIHQMSYRLNKKHTKTMLELCLDASNSFDFTKFHNNSCVIINGAEDPLVDIYDVEILEKMSFQCEKIVIIPKAGHSLVEEVPEVLAKSIIDNS